jgi:HK97 family phage portal protein
MGWFQKLGASLFGEKRDTLDNRWWGPSPAVVSSAGVSVTRESALELDVIQAILEVLGGIASTLPLTVYRRVGDGKEPAFNHWLYPIMAVRPNAWQTRQEFLDEITRHLAFERNCYCRLLDGESGIGGLEIIHPTRVAKVERRQDGRVYYTIASLSVDGQYEVLRDDQIWHVRKAPLTVDGLQGVPVWQTGREAIGRALAVERYGARWFRNSGKSGGFIEHPGTFKSKEDELAFLAAWRSASTGESQHSDRLLKYGMKYQPSVVNNDEAQFIETLKHAEIKVARLWQMPPHRIQILDRATFSNIEQQGLDFKIYAAMPWLAAIEQGINRDLLSEDEQAEYFVEFNVEGLMRGDVKSRFDAYAQARQWGWLSVNDIRKLENQSAIGPSGDVYLQPMNMNQAGQTQQQGAQHEG